MEGNEVEEAIKFLQKEKYTPKLRKEFERAILLLEKQNEERLGLSASQIAELINTIIMTPFDHRILNLPNLLGGRLIQCLVPSERIPSELVAQLTMKLLTSFRSLDVKTTLMAALRWLNCILQYNVCHMDDVEVLYEPLLTLLHKQPLTSLVMDLLLKITGNKKYVVTKRRLRVLKDVESDHVNVLMRHYQHLRPDLVTEKIPLVKRTAKHFDGTMERTFADLWNSNTNNQGGDNPVGNLVHLSPKVNSLIPSLSYESIGDAENDKKLIHDCKTVKDLVSNLHRLQMPNQALSLLNNPALCALLLQLNSTPTEIQERLSITLYFTLHNEFLSMSRNQKQSQKKTDLLRRIVMLQECLQHGLPVVGRFLAEYLAAWDGQEYFSEICQMLSFLPITDFAELDECILSPIRQLCNDSKLKWNNQTVLLGYLSRLVRHWALSECRADRPASNLLFPWANTSCDNPYETISGLCEFISQQAENGLYHLVASTEASQAAFRMELYQHEILSMFSSISQCFVQYKVPIRPELPSHFIYFSVFGRNPVFFAKSLHHLTQVKQEIIPLCQNIRKEHGRIDLKRRMATSTEEKIALLENVAKDVLASVDMEKYLTRGESIFRKEWSIDDHFIREMLSLKNHPVHIPYLLKLFAAGSQVQMDISSLSDEGSMAFEDYWKLLSEHAPQVIHFLKAFRSKSETACRKPSQPSIISTATHSSGFGSIPSSELM